MGAAGAERATAISVPDIVAAAEAESEAAATLPDLPADCRRTERTGVQTGDRLDAAVLVSDGALGRANARIVRCAAWHDELRRERKGHQ